MNELSVINTVEGIWAKDPSLWTNKDEANWLGWLSAGTDNQDIPRMRALAIEIKEEGFKDIVLLGMGGSSLCPALCAEVYVNNSFPKLHILDSTDPQQILCLESKINLTKTVFVVSSKSGTTLESAILKDYFYFRVQQTLSNKEKVGHQFIAITDPGTPLELVAKKENFRAIFNGNPQIGGRYSALSNFGLVPFALMGGDVESFLKFAAHMQSKCQATEIINNPGAALGFKIGMFAKEGKDKLSLIISPSIRSLGDWIEQLVAESIGKNGKGIVPINEVVLSNPSFFSEDRVFVYIRLEEDPDSTQDTFIAELKVIGVPIIEINVPSKIHLGAEFFRWEFATAVIGSLLAINPFNQPDVEESKVLTMKLTKNYEETLSLEHVEPFFSEGQVKLIADEINIKSIHNNLSDEKNLVAYLQAHLNRARQPDYINFSAFIEMSSDHFELLHQMNTFIRDNKKIATCLGFGPRFLHSTGQNFKGGSNTGVFIQLIAEPLQDLEIPSRKLTFGKVLAAQAQADFAVLCQRQRRVLQINLGKNVKAGLQQLHQSIQQITF